MRHEQSRYYIPQANHQPNEQGWIIIAAIFGLGFIFSVLALVCALIALCR